MKHSAPKRKSTKTASKNKQGTGQTAKQSKEDELLLKVKNPIGNEPDPETQLGSPDTDEILKAYPKSYTRSSGCDDQGIRALKDLKENMEMSTTGPKTLKGSRSSIPFAPADHPIYTRGFAVGGYYSKSSSKDTQETSSKKQNDQQESDTPSVIYERALLKLLQDTDAELKAQRQSSESTTEKQAEQNSTAKKGK